VKALTLHQPWASLIAVGAKRIETRNWATDYRGPLAIHASRSQRYVGVDFDSPYGAVVREMGPEWPSLVREALTDGALLYSPDRVGFPPFTVHEDEYPWRAIPVGAVVATARLVEVVPIYLECEEGQLRRVQVFQTGLWLADPEDDGDEDVQDIGSERPFGDFTPGRFAWIFEDIHALPEPVPAKGHQRLWNWNEPKS
jgi:activating signal cointegrator 1